MTTFDIQMCVADAMQDDDIENADSILRMLNSTAESSWREARGQEFTVDEVKSAIRELLHASMITPCAESAACGDCVPIAAEQVDSDFPIESLWFHLEQLGRDAVNQWWESVGRIKFPLEQTE